MVSSSIEHASGDRRALGAFETAQALTDAHTPFNVVTVLSLRNGPPEQTVRWALDALQERHPLLRSKIEPDRGRFHFQPTTQPIPLESQERRGDATWMEAVESELGLALDTEMGPLVRCRLVMESALGTDSELILTFHHSIMDATSGANVVRELLSACAAIEAGETPGLGPPLPLMPAEDDLFPDTAPGGRRRSSTVGFLARQMADEISYRWRTRRSRRPPVHPHGTCRVLCRRLGQAETTALIRTCRARRLPLNSALNAAMLAAVHRQLYHGESTLLRHFNFADLRPVLVPRVAEEHLGSYHGMLRVTVPMPSGSDLWTTAATVNEMISDAARRGDTFQAALMSPSMMRMILRQNRQRMGTTALSYTGPSRLPRKFGAIEASSPEVFISNLTLGPEFTAQARLADGELRWNIVYLECDMDRATAERISDVMLDILRAGSAGGEG